MAESASFADMGRWNVSYFLVFIFIEKLPMLPIYYTLVRQFTR